MSFVKAIYEETGEECYVNMDCVIDVMHKGENWIAYTFDNDRGGYIITQEDLNKCFENWNRVKVEKG